MNATKEMVNYRKGKEISRQSVRMAGREYRCMTLVDIVKGELENLRGPIWADETILLAGYYPPSPWRLIEATERA